MIEPNTPIYSALKWFAIAMGVFVVGATVYQYIFVGDEPGQLYYRRGNLRLQDGEPKEALAEFRKHLETNPGHPGGLLGEALALMALDRDHEALAAFDEALEAEPDFAAAYADRGILLDRMGRHQEALEDYRKALQLDPSLGEGPGWLTRFLRNQWEPPPTIADRARYLEQELEKPPGERVLRVPEEDSQQRMYKVYGEL